MFVPVPCAEQQIWDAKGNEPINVRSNLWNAKLNGLSYSILSYSFFQLFLLSATLTFSYSDPSYSFSELLLLSATLISATLILSYSVSASLIFSYSTHSYSISAILLSAILLSGGTRICISEVFQLNFLR